MKQPNYEQTRPEDDQIPIRTIADPDWERELKRARAQENKLLTKIREVAERLEEKPGSHNFTD